MAFSKTHLYTEKDVLLGFYSRALSHSGRPAIIRKLAHDGPCCVEQLLKSHPISAPTISQHLEILRKSQLVNFKEIYPYIFYDLNEENIEKMRKAYERFFNSL